jgi:hypothetical protein
MNVLGVIMNDDKNFALIAWIKKEQEKERSHQEKKALTRDDEDKLYLEMIGMILHKVNHKQQIILLNLARIKMEGKNLSDGQRSFITGLFYTERAM